MLQALQTIMHQLDATTGANMTTLGTTWVPSMRRRGSMGTTTSPRRLLRVKGTCFRTSCRLLKLLHMFNFHQPRCPRHRLNNISKPHPECGSARQSSDNILATTQALMTLGMNGARRP